jgi:hypothetical protein
MKNKTIVWGWIFGTGATFAGGFIEGYNGYSDGMSTFLSGGGIIVIWIFMIVGMVRLWKTSDAD